ncbi:MAG: RNA 2',3'-cyclic phosphodiesterase [Thiohalomonadaceae bacterium]
MTEAAPTRRLFFALWPDDETRARLARVARAVGPPCGGRTVPAGNLHLTLEFLGNVPAATLDCLLGCGSAYTGEGFRLVIDRAGSFNRTGIVWLGPAEVPAALTRIYEHLHAGVACCGLVPEERPFRPHLTVMRKARRAPATEPFEPVPWVVDDFVLVESVTSPEGSSYQVLRRWPLQAAGRRRPLQAGSDAGNRG